MHPVLDLQPGGSRSIERSGDSGDLRMIQVIQESQVSKMI